MSEKNFKERNIPDRVIRIELISLFSFNPETSGSAQEIAAILERDANQVRNQMEELVSLRILRKESNGGSDLYRYIPAVSNIKVRKRFLVEDPVSACSGGLITGSINQNEEPGLGEETEESGEEKACGNRI